MAQGAYGFGSDVASNCAHATLGAPIRKLYIPPQRRPAPVPAPVPAF